MYLLDMSKDIPENQNSIWRLIKSGDRNAFQKLYEMHFKDLLKYGKYLCSQDAVVEDAIHDVFVSLYNYRKKLAENVNIKHYLFSCLRRQLLKSNKNKLFISTDNPAEFDQVTDQVDCKEISIMNSESDREILLALKKEVEQLTEHQREVIYLRFVQDLSYEEIAKVMGISVNSSRTLLYRAIKLLRSKLSELDLDTFPNIHISGYKKAIFSAILIYILK